ncbi:uncharacterized protein [Haliotis cracherodii]|uniref:uncharacterized protein isoform X2 n=1 Tax=Haliotis cracherodii TaxID=6455 RepID=UPI0039EB4BC2
MPEPIMQNGADTVKDHLESAPGPPASSILVTEAEISVEAIKHSKQEASIVAESSDTSAIGSSGLEQVEPDTDAFGLIQKAKNGTPSALSALDTPDLDNKPEKSQSDEKDQVEAGVEEVLKEAVLEEEKAGMEEEPQPKGDADKDVIKPENDTMKETVPEPGSDKDESQKKKLGRPRKIDSGEKVVEKVKKKMGRPRKHPVAEDVAEDNVKEAEVEKVVATEDAAPEVDVDLFTYVPGKTSDPIQLSTVSSIVSGSEGTASMDGDTLENSIKSGEGGLLNGSKHSEVKKLLKTKILSSEKSRKRKASVDKVSQAKVKKSGSRPPAEDSSSSQKEQDLNDFLDATQKALSGQETNGVGDTHEEGDDSAAALMAKGPCLDSDDDDEQLKSYLKIPAPNKPWSIKKRKKKQYLTLSTKKKSPKSPENLKRLAEMATMQNSFEALNTSFVGEPEVNDGAMSSVVGGDSLDGETDSSAKSSKTKSIVKKNAFAVLREQLSQEPRLNDAVLDIHNGDMIPPIPDSAEEFQSPKRRIKKFKEEPDRDDMVEPYSKPGETGIGKQDITLTEPKTADVKKVPKGNSPRSKMRKKKFHKWNKKKKHSPAVLQRLEAQLKAMKAAIEAEKNASSHGVQPEMSVSAGLMNIKKYGKKVLSQIKINQKKYASNGNDDVVESLFSTPAAGSAPPAPRRLQVAKRGRGRGMKMGRGGGLTNKKSSPIVRLSPLGPPNDTASLNNSVSDIFADAEMMDAEHPRDEDPPVLTKISTMEPVKSSMKRPMLSNQEEALDRSVFVDVHSKMQNKKSFLKPREATEFASDTGAVSLKNILPASRRATAPKKNAFAVKRSYKRSLHNCGMKRGMKKGYGRGGGRGLASRRMIRPGMAMSNSGTGVVDPGLLSPDQCSRGTPLHRSPHSQTPILESDQIHQGGFYGKNVHRRAEGHRKSRERSGGQSSPSRDSRHSSGQEFRKRSSPGSYRHSMSEDNDQASGSEQNSNKSFSYSPNRKSGIGSTVGAVISQLFGDEMPRLVPGSGYVINVRLDVERKEATGSHKSHKNVSTQEDLDYDRRRHTSHHSTSREKSTHVSSTVNSYSRKSSHSEPQPSTSASPDDPYPRERTAQRPRISDVDLCAMLEERISSRRGLRVDVRDNLLDNIKHVERVLKESS